MIDTMYSLLLSNGFSDLIWWATPHLYVCKNEFLCSLVLFFVFLFCFLFCFVFVCLCDT